MLFIHGPSSHDITRRDEVPKEPMQRLTLD
jgi:hypothetical protein